MLNIKKIIKEEYNKLNEIGVHDLGINSSDNEDLIKIKKFLSLSPEDRKTPLKANDKQVYVFRATNNNEVENILSGKKSGSFWNTNGTYPNDYILIAKDRLIGNHKSFESRMEFYNSLQKRDENGNLIYVDNPNFRRPNKFIDTFNEVGAHRSIDEIDYIIEDHTGNVIYPKDINKIIKEEIENFNKIIKLYHRIGNKQNLFLSELIKSVLKKGLIPSDNGEIGNVIWFSNDYNDYGKNASFVVTYDFDINTNGIGNNKYDIIYDGHNAYAYKPIPFNDLDILKIPILVFNTHNNIQTNVDVIEIINDKKWGITPEKLNELDITIFGDLFNKYVQPYIDYPNFLSLLDPNKIKIVNVLN